MQKYEVVHSDAIFVFAIMLIWFSWLRA